MAVVFWLLVAILHLTIPAGSIDAHELLVLAPAVVAIAACVATTRARAEDLAERVTVGCDELPAVVDAIAAMRPDSARLFDTWADNAYIARTISATA